MKKKLTPMEIHRQINNEIMNMSNIRFITANENKTVYYRDDHLNGHYEIIVSTHCEGNMIGSIAITYHHPIEGEDFDLLSYFIYNNSDPAQLVKKIEEEILYWLTLTEQELNGGENIMSDYKSSINCLKHQGVTYRTFINDNAEMVIRYNEYGDDYTDEVYDTTGKLIRIVDFEDGDMYTWFN